MLAICCDNPICDKRTTPANSRYCGWIEVARPRSVMNEYVLDKFNYCSLACEYNHLYVLTHADAGK